MKQEEVDKIFKSWQDYMEIADKMRWIFMRIPESFLPYPKDVLEEVLNIVAKQYFDQGDKKMAETIQTTIAGFLWTHEPDEVALETIHNFLGLILKDAELKNLKLAKLEESRLKWEQIRNDSN